MAGKIETSDLKIITPVGIACFAHVFEPHAFEGGKSQFSLILVFAEGTDLTELKQTCGKAAIRKFNDKATVQKMMKAGKLRMPWRDGSEYEQYGEPFVEGATFISLKSNQAPGVVGPNAKPMMNAMDFYAGCKARASAVCWPYDSMGNQGVTLLLNNVQKVGEGTKLSGKTNAEDEFDAVAPAKGEKGGKGKPAADDAFGGDSDDDDIPF